MEWTKDQLEGIENREGNLVVSAAAGSGKTALLAERIKRTILEDGVPAESLLVLTFTRSAAGEVKSRVKLALYKAASEASGEERERILKEADALDEAQISTIHSFAADAIRRRSAEAGVDPAFRVMDSGRQAALLERAWEEVSEELLEGGERGENGEFMELCEAFGGHSGTDGVKKGVMALLGFLETVPDIGEWEALAFPEEGGGPASWEVLRKEGAQAAADAVPVWDAVIAEAEGMPFGKGAKGPAVLREEREALARCAAAGSLEELADAWASLSFGTFRAPKSCKEGGGRIAALRNPAKKRVRKALGFLDGFDRDSAMEVERASLRSCRALFDTAMAVKGRFDEIKGRELSYSDLERGLLRALGDEGVRRELSSRFARILVDEAQDLNGVQERAISLIERGDNRFMVGDVKQSVFGFRSADPKIFADIRKKAAAGGSEVELRQNFRCSLPVVRAVNAVFDGLMTERLGGVDYDGSQRLETAETAEGERPKVEVLFCAEELKEEVQAARAAREARRLVEEEGYAWGDIAVLCRSANKRAPVIRRVFAAEGVPLSFDGDSGFFGEIETELFESLLAVSVNPDRDLELAAVLRLPLFGFSADDFAAARAGLPEGLPLWQCLRLASEREDGLGERLRDAYRILDGWRLAGRTMPPGDFAERVAQESGLYAFCSGMGGGRRRKGNVRALAQAAGRYKGPYGGGIAGFLSYLQDVREAGGTISAGTSSDPDSVRLMSIHKAKGLEFPVVMLLDASRRFRRPGKGDFLFDRELGIAGRAASVSGGVQRRQDSLSAEAMAARRRKDELSEEMRLLYVALTRARDTFYVISADSRKRESLERVWEDSSPAAMEGAACMLDWVMASAGKSGALDVAFPPAEGLSDVPSGKAGAEPASERVLERLREAPAPEAAPVRRATTVSRLKGGKSPASLAGPAAGEAAEYGSNVHAVLSRMDLASYEPDAFRLSGFVSQLAREGVVKGREPDVFGIERFLESPQGLRLRAAAKEGRELLREAEFTADLSPEEAGTEGPVRVTGVVDCMFLEDGEWVIFDYKTDSKKSLAESPERLASYKEQLRLYALAAEKLTGIPVKEKMLIFLSQAA